MTSLQSMPPAPTAPASRDRSVGYEWTVAGLDCAGCAATARAAVERLAGVTDVDVSFLVSRLSLTLDETRAAPESVEAAVAALGYRLSGRRRAGAAAVGGPATSGQHAPRTSAPGSGTPAADAWWRGAKGRLVLLTGGMLALAWLAEALAPEPVSGAAFVAACLVGLAPVARRAVALLRAGQPFTIEMLMTIAALGALAIDAAGEAAVVVFLFAVGEMLEGVAADRARSGIRALQALLPETALLLAPEGTRSVAADRLVAGDRVLVRPGDRIPADGRIVDGLSGVDESPITGESMPRPRGPGEEVAAGSVNLEAVLVVEVTRAAGDNTIARIIRLVEEAQSRRAPTERFIDRMSRVYMPAIVALAVLVAVVPPLALAEPWDVWVYRALALLLIGCPCALVISVPAAIAAGLSCGARRGLLLKGGVAIEAAAAVRTVAFDKTGTLTAGQPVVTDILAWRAASEQDAGAVAMADAERGEAAVLALAAAVESGSNHPLARAIVSRARAAGVAVPPAGSIRAVPGRGADGEVAGEPVTVASPAHAVELAALPAGLGAAIARLEDAGKTVVVVLRGAPATPLGVIALRDELRADAASAVHQLAALGLSCVMLTGDNARTAAALGGALGIDQRAGLRPEQKLAEIARLGAAGPVMMVGDGINDAPALKAARLGVAMGSGTDVALETADAAILRDRVADVPALIRLSRATMANIRQNVAIALGLKAVFLVTSVLGVTGLWIAILADTGATVLVTANGLRLLAHDPGREGGGEVSAPAARSR